MTDAVKIYHNPRCSKSRETLSLLQSRGIDPEVVLYLETPPDAGTNIISGDKFSYFYIASDGVIVTGA